MKIWDKFNAGFQLCPPDFNFAPRSREAGDAPVRVSNTSHEKPIYYWQTRQNAVYNSY